MQPFLMTLRWLGWEKEIVRGASVQRRYYPADADSEYLLDLCLQNKCNRFIVGTGPEINYRPLFRTKGVSIISQRWQGSANLPARDSILDAVARLSVADICERMR